MSHVQYKNYLLCLLTVVAVFNYLDRGVLALMMESLKDEFELTDSQLGLMSGFAFAFFYAVAGIPIARWADRGNRNHVVTLTTGMWSVMLTASAMVGNFTQLLLVRVGVAVGEAGCVPTAQSLISDYFDRAERPRALAIYWMSAPISTVLAYLGGGWLIDQYGWRITFMVIGIPGIILAIVVKLTLREPRIVQQTLARANSVISGSAVKSKQLPLKAVLKVLWFKPAFRHVVMGYCITLFFGAGIGVWIPAFFMRTHSMDASELGVWLALTWGVIGVPSTFLGGFLAVRYASCKERIQMKCVAILVGFCAVFHSLCYLSNNKYIALLFVSIVAGVLIPLVMAPIHSSIQSLVEERMRAVAIAFIFMLANAIGLGLGPVVVGVLSDFLSSIFGTQSLRYALLLFCPGYLWCAFHFWKAANTIEEEISAVEKENCLAGSDQSVSSVNKLQDEVAAKEKVTWRFSRS